MGRFEASYEDLCVESAFHSGGIGTFQKEFDRFLKVGCGCFNNVP